MAVMVSHATVTWQLYATVTHMAVMVSHVQQTHGSHGESCATVTWQLW